MGILALSGKLTRHSLRRILLFVCLTALLCLAAGLLGNSLLYGNKSVVEPVRVAVVDRDDTGQSHMLVRYLTELEGYEELISFTLTEEAEADALIRAGGLDAVLFIPKEFIAGVIDGRNMPFSVTLRGDSPFRASIIRVFAGVYADMLRTGQIGVYACLTAAGEVGREARDQMFGDANLRYFTAMLNGRAMIGAQELSATGTVSAPVQYAASTLVFVMLLGGVLFLDLWKRAAARPILLRLKAQGQPALATGGCFLVGATFPFLLSEVVLAAGMALLLRGQWGDSVSVISLVFALLLLAACAASLMMAVSAWIGGGAEGCVFLFVTNLFCLFVSGGILPAAYLSPLLQSIGTFTPHLWLTRLLLGALEGSSDPLVWLLCLGWTALFAALALLGIWRQGKVGLKP